MEPGKAASERRKRPRSRPQLTMAASSCAGQKAPVTLCGRGRRGQRQRGHGGGVATATAPHRHDGHGAVTATIAAPRRPRHRAHPLSFAPRRALRAHAPPSPCAPLVPLCAPPAHSPPPPCARFARPPPPSRSTPPWRPLPAPPGTCPKRAGPPAPPHRTCTSTRASPAMGAAGGRGLPGWGRSLPWPTSAPSAGGR